MFRGATRLILLVNLIAALARLMGPGGLRSVVAESLGQAVIAHSQSLAAPGADQGMGVGGQSVQSSRTRANTINT